MTPVIMTRLTTVLGVIPISPAGGTYESQSPLLNILDKHLQCSPQNWSMKTHCTVPRVRQISSLKDADNQYIQKISRNSLSSHKSITNFQPIGSILHGDTEDFQPSGNYSLMHLKAGNSLDVHVHSRVSQTSSPIEVYYKETQKISILQETIHFTYVPWSDHHQLQN